MKITKRQEKQLSQVSEGLSRLVKSITDASEAELPQVLRAQTQWDTSKGTLMNWISVLNKFDNILERITTKYGLTKDYTKPQELNQEDTSLVVAILDFTHLLLENCTVKSLYLTSHRLFDLLNSPTVSVIIPVLRVFAVLAQKFSIRSSKKTILSTRKVSDRLYPFASFLPASTLTSNIGTPDGLTLIDYIKDNSQVPQKWKQLEYVYFNTPEDTKPKDLMESTIRKLNTQDDVSLASTSSPSKRRKNQPKDERVEIAKAEGLQGARSLKFVMGEDDVRKLSLQQIYDKGSEKLPAKTWLKFSLKALMAKSFNSNAYDNIQLRRDLVIIKCLAISILVSVQSEFEVTARIFEADPALLTSLIDLVNLNNNVPHDVRLVAIKALDCISSMKTWSSEIVRGLGGSVPHGLLFQNLRHIKKQMKNNETAKINEEFNMIFFNVISNLVQMKSMSTLLVSAGLIEQLTEFLNIRSGHRSTLSGAAHLLDSTLSGISDNVAIFRENDGFNSLIGVIREEIEFALDNPNYGGGPPVLSVVHYSISYKQANYIRSLLRFAHHLIQKESGDRVRNLFDSPLLDSINKILLNPSTFGYTLLTLAINSTSSIIHNEPTSYMILKEAGTIDIIVNNFESFFGESGELLSALPNVTGAIALNTEGLEKVKDHELIQKLFTIFDNNNYAKVLVNDDLSDLLSGSIDELARHYPQLKPIIVDEVVKLIIRLPEVGTKGLPRPYIFKSDKGSFYKSTEEEVIDVEEGIPELATWESIDEAYILENASVFIGNLIMFSNTWFSVMESLPYERWIPLVCLKNSPFDYFYSNAMYPLNGALKYFDDENREYADKDVLLNKMHELANVVAPFAKSTSKESIFHTLEDEPLDDLFNDLICINNLLFSFTDVYCNARALSASRVEQLSRYFSDDRGIEILQNLGALYKRTAFEEYKLKTSMPKSVANQTSVYHVDDGVPPIRIIEKEVDESDMADKKSAKLNNSLQVRFVLHRIHASVATIFGTLLELPTANRQSASTLERYRAKSVKVAQEIGKIFSSLLTEDLLETPSLALILVDSIQYSLVNPISDKVLSIGAIMFMQEGGYLKLRSILVHFWKKVIIQDNSKLVDLKPTTYVRDFEESINAAIVMNILVHFNKLVVFEQLSEIQYSTLFYEGDFDGSSPEQAKHLKASFLVQAKILTLGALSSIFDENSFDSIDRELPLPVVEELIKLTKHIYLNSGAKELELADGSLFKLEWQYARYSTNRVEYLKSIGVDEDKALTMLYKSAGSLSFLKSHDLPRGFEDLEKWSDIRNASKQIRYQPPEPKLVESQFNGYHTVTELDILRENKVDHLRDQLYLLAQLHPTVSSKVADFLTSTVLNKANVSTFESVMFNLLDFIVSFEFPNNDSPKLSAMLAIFSELLTKETVFYGCHAPIESFAENVVCQVSSENTNTDWANLILLLCVKLVAAYNLPQVEKLDVPVNLSLPESLPVPFRVSKKTYDEVFETLIGIPKIVGRGPAGTVSKLLAIYSTDYDYVTRIIKSGIIRKIIGQLDQPFGPAKSEKPPGADGLARVAFAILVRRCFETKDYITDHIVREISRQFTSKRDGSQDKPKDLKTILKDSYGTVLRSPEIFVEEFTKRARLNNFSEPLKSWSVIHFDPSDKDTQMTDAKVNEKASRPELSATEQSTLLKNQTGIIHLILTELMVASKKDWLSDPPLTEEEQKKKEEDEKNREIPEVSKTEVGKNKNCNYIIFLLKLLQELLSSYKQSKIEFLTFSKKQLLQESSDDQIKPRSTSLNFLLHQFIGGSAKTLPPNENSRRQAVARQAGKVVVAFVSSLDSRELKVDAKRVDPDLTFIRKFTIDSIQKTIREISSSTPVLELRYRKLVSVCEIIPSLLSNLRDKLVDPLTAEFDDYHIGKIILESELIPTVSQILSEVDLNYPEYFFILESVVNILNNLGSIKNDRQELFRTSQPNNGNDEEEVEVDENDFKEETPDLFQNSTLGMYDVGEVDSEDEYTGDEIGYNEGDVSDSEEPDEDDIDDDLMSGRDVEIVYSEEDGEDSHDDDMISSDEGEVVSDSDQDMDDESNSDSGSDSASNSGSDLDNSDSDNYIEYDFVPEIEGEEVGRDSESELDLSNDSEFNGYSSGEESLGNVIVDLDSELEEEVEHIISENEHGEPVNSGRRPFHNHSASDDGIQTAEDDDDHDLDDEFDSDSSSDDGLAINLNGGNDHRAFHGRHRRNGGNEQNSGSVRRFMNSINIDNIGGATIIRGLDPSNTPSQFFSRNEGLLSELLRSSDVIVSRQRNEENTLNVVSTRERWNLLADAVFNRNLDASRVLTAILNRLYGPSKEFADLKKKERDEERRAKEEEIRRTTEELERRRAAEEEERLNAAANTDEGNETGDSEAIGSRSPIMVSIGNRQVDIAGTDIDPEFFEALPDDMREEVFTQHITERRSQTQQSGSSSREIAQEFLDALPAGIREEILAQEAAQGSNDFSDLLEVQAETTADTANPVQDDKKPKEKQKVFYTPLVDNAGVASLVRFVFVPQSFNGRKALYSLLAKISINKKTRSEVFGYLVAILQYGISDQESLEKAFVSITYASSQSTSHAGDKFGTPKSSNSHNKPQAAQSLFPQRTTPFIVASQVLEAIQFLLESDPQLRYYFLTEHEAISLAKKPASARKPAMVKPSKFPLNSLLALLNKGIIREKSNLMDLLSRIIQITTRPLNALKKAQSVNDKKRIELPSVLNSSLRNVITIMVSDNCSSRTFQQTLSAIQNLLVVCPGGEVFANELSKDAKKLGDNLAVDLTALYEYLSKNPEIEDYESSVMAKFTSSNSDQSKLLRVLTALDYLFGDNEKPDKDEDENMDEDHPKEKLTNIYNGLDLGELWGALSETLELFETHKSMTSIATTLLPTIEALMVICKHSRVKDIQNKDVLKYESKKVDYSTEPIENLFFVFTDAHKKILNTMVRSNPKLMSGPFTMLVQNPRVLEFDNKKNYFDRQLHSDNDSAKQALQISVRRDQVFLDSYRALFFKPKDLFRDSKLEISFKGEAGVDAGGITREWYQVLSRQMFNPDYALFLPVASDKTTFHPNRTSWVNPEHLSFFKFIGRVIGKAIYDNCFLDCHFSRDVYKSILGRSVSLKDLETIDLEYYNSLMWMLENDITDVIIETFSVETEDYGEVKTIDLIPNGRDISVTEDNKHEYVRLVVEYRLQTSVKEQVDNFLQGFHEIIPKSLISIFDEQELELLVSGLPDIDVDDWKNNTVYINYSSSSKEILYFWRAVRSFDKEERAKLLQFATGTSKVPLNGFKELEGSNGATKFSIHKDFGSTERLPSSHTCFNQIDLPAYDSYETLRGSLLLAITEGHEGFGIA
jgi:E3 ubiquitin-protein ligase HUWE1